MLGNFSFGDYFKEDAIPFAWDLITKEFGIDRNKLLVTVYHTDEEAVNIWKKHAGLSDDRIIRIATDDNFWSLTMFQSDCQVNCLSRGSSIVSKWSFAKFNECSSSETFTKS